MRGVLWDMDGTLVDTAELHYEAWRATCRKRSRDLTLAEFFATFGRRNDEVIPLLFGEAAQDAVAAIGFEKEELYRAAVVEHGVELLRGAPEALARFAAAGRAQAIASSAPRANIEQILTQTRAGSYFGAMIGGEDVRRGKPDPEVFLTAAAALGLAAVDCLVLEDAPAGVQAAKAAGMRCIAVTFRSHHTAPDLLAAGADRVIADLTEL
jgi:beta-phosphoglucomutase